MEIPVSFREGSFPWGPMYRFLGGDMVLLEKDLATVGLKGELRPFELHGLRFFQQTTEGPIWKPGDI